MSADTQRRPTWLVVLIVIAVLAAVLAAVARGYYRDGPLEPDAPTGQGSRAAVSVLRDLGVEVETQRHTADAVEDLAEGRTVLVTDPGALSGEQLQTLSGALESSSGTLVLVQPDFVTLGYLTSVISPAGAVRTPTSVEAGDGCDGAGFRARTIHVPGEEGLVGPATTYRTAGDATGCFTSGAGALVAVAANVVVLGSPDLLTNDGIGEADNSALVLNALGGAGSLTWYVPSPGDPMASTGPDLLSYLPDWASSVALWLLITVAITLIAFSRRLGPVVVEPLPVTVRPQELVLGRARLQQQARARDSAAASLRTASMRRLADRLGIRQVETLDALVAALTPHLEQPPERIRSLLGPTPVRSDHDLVQLAHDLDLLEKEIDR